MAQHEGQSSRPARLGRPDRCRARTLSPRSTSTAPGSTRSSSARTVSPSRCSMSTREGHSHEIAHKAGNPDGNLRGRQPRYWREITDALRAGRRDPAAGARQRQGQRVTPVGGLRREARPGRGRQGRRRRAGRHRQPQRRRGARLGPGTTSANWTRCATTAATPAPRSPRPSRWPGPGRTKPMRVSRRSSSGGPSATTAPIDRMRPKAPTGRWRTSRSRTRNRTSRRCRSTAPSRPTRSRRPSRATRYTTPSPATGWTE